MSFKRYLPKPPPSSLFPVTVLAVGLVAILAAAIFGIRANAELEDLCREKGGVYLVGKNRNICVNMKAIIAL